MLTCLSIIFDSINSLNLIHQSGGAINAHTGKGVTLGLAKAYIIVSPNYFAF